MSSVNVPDNILEIRDWVAQKVGAPTYKENIEKMLQLVEYQDQLITELMSQIVNLQIEVMTLGGGQ